MMIKASSCKMTFDFSTIKFSKNIVGDIEIKNNGVFVDVDYESYKNKTTFFSNATSYAIGV